MLLTPRAASSAEKLFGRGVPDELAETLASIGLLAELVRLVSHYGDGGEVSVVLLGPVRRWSTGRC